MDANQHLAELFWRLNPGSCLLGSMLLHHTDLGGADKPPMLVLHGLLGSSRNWLSTGRDLAKHNHVFALDARNHGKSPHASEMNYDVMVADILAWMDGQGLARAVIVGHSMGGKTAMQLACRHPQLRIGRCGGVGPLLEPARRNQTRLLVGRDATQPARDRKSTRLNSNHRP